MKQATNAFYGVATIGAKGQIVIPAEAREAFDLNAGDKVIVFGRQPAGKDFGVLCVCPIASAEQFVASMTDQLSRTQAAIAQAKNNNSN